MDLAGAERNETIDAMIDYLIKTQADDGAWDFQSVRPPAASSRSMTTAIAVYGLRAYGPDYVGKSRLQEVFEKANAWSRQANESRVKKSSMDWRGWTTCFATKWPRRFSLMRMPLRRS